jgi:hypothetical protein
LQHARQIYDVREVPQVVSGYTPETDQEKRNKKPPETCYTPDEFPFGRFSLSELVVAILKAFVVLVGRYNG